MSKRMDIKQLMLKQIVQDTRLSAFVYERYKAKEEVKVRELIDEISRTDSLQNPKPLLRLKRQIADGGRMFYSHNLNTTNYRLYGIGNALFGIPASQIPLSPSIEHGLIFHNRNWTDTALTARAGCVTFGTFRKDILRRYYDTPIFEVGPYIQYASDYYDVPYAKKWKQKLGRTLLVYPMHGTDDDEVSYQKKYIQEVETYAHDFDSVIVCAFWWNLDDPLMDAFRDCGFHIASAGFREDANFLPRQKALIGAADLIVTDSIGTHIGYCYHYGKDIRLLDAGSMTAQKPDPFELQHKEKIARVIRNGSPKSLQKCMQEYWGSGISLTRKQLRAVFEINREITLRGNFKLRNYHSAAQRLLAEYKEKDTVKYELLKHAIR